MREEQGHCKWTPVCIVESGGWSIWVWPWPGRMTELLTCSLFLVSVSLFLTYLMHGIRAGGRQTGRNGLWTDGRTRDWPLRDLDSEWMDGWVLCLFVHN